MHYAQHFQSAVYHLYFDVACAVTSTLLGYLSSSLMCLSASEGDDSCRPVDASSEDGQEGAWSDPAARH